jgi:ADP-ribosylglycohydrolase
VDLDTVQLDRACGVLLASAAGDALGAGYEFGPPLDDDVTVAMTGGGHFRWAPGEWTDDTSMAIAIAEVAATGADMRDTPAQDRVVTRWVEWAGSAKDIGTQTRYVLAEVDGGGAAAALAASWNLHQRTGRTAGNGSLMRTGPVPLSYLDDAEALAHVARSVSNLTHFDPEAGDACVLWCLAIRHAVLTGELDVRTGLDLLPAERRDLWSQRLADAVAARPRDFTRNGWVVEALQAAWCAIATTPAGPEHLRRALEAAVRGGGDTDTVAAIAGALLGAAYGASAVPSVWQQLLHGWPGLRAADVADLGMRICQRSRA